jgi:cobalt-zinc-cadmium efflux system protein
LLADAGHMATDAVGIALALFALWIGARQATPQKTWGYWRAEILAALINGLILLGFSIFVFYEAWQRLREPEPVASGPMFVLAVIGLVVNLAGMFLLHGHAGENLNARGAYLEVSKDLLGSAAVIVAAGIIMLTGWVWVDPVISALVGVFILPRTWLVLREAVDILMEATPKGIDIAAVRQAMSGVCGCGNIHDLHVWAIGSGKLALSGHVAVAERIDRDRLLLDMNRLLRERFKIGHVTLQVEGRDIDEDLLQSEH